MLTADSARPFSDLINLSRVGRMKTFSRFFRFDSWNKEQAIFYHNSLSTTKVIYLKLTFWHLSEAIIRKDCISSSGSWHDGKMPCQEELEEMSNNCLNLKSQNSWILTLFSTLIQQNNQTDILNTLKTVQFCSIRTNPWWWTTAFRIIAIQSAVIIIIIVIVCTRVGPISRKILGQF